MPISSPQVHANQGSQTSGTRGKGQTSAEPSGIEGMFARIASELSADDAPTLASSTSEAPNGQPPVLDPDNLPLAAIQDAGTPVNFPQLDLSTDDMSPSDISAGTDELNIKTDAGNSQAPDAGHLHGLAHATSVLESIQNARVALGGTTPKAGDLAPLATAIQAVDKARTGKMLMTDVKGDIQQLSTTSAPKGSVLANLAVAPASNNNAQNNSQLTPAQQSLIKALPIAGNANESFSVETSPIDSKATPVALAGTGSHVMTGVDGASRVVKMDIPGNIQQPAWQNALAERVLFAAGQSIKQADLQIHPAELGPVNIRIETHQDKAAVQFTAMHADTREALDAALPRLREMFSQQGMDLVRADIQQNLTGHQQDQSTENQTFSENTEQQSLMPESVALGQGVPPRAVRQDSILDLYA